MANVSVYNMGGQEVGTMEVSDAVFAADTWYIWLSCST